MGYTKTVWDASTPLSESNLAHLESQADALDSAMLAVNHSADYYTITEYVSRFFNITAMGPGSGADADLLGGRTKAQVLAASVPVSTVIMWHGNIASLPAGFLRCDGSNGTPNMGNRLPFGGNYNIKTAGGQASTAWAGNVSIQSHVLTIQELANHTHNWYDEYPSGLTDMCTKYDTPLATGNQNYCVTSFTGGGGGHSSNATLTGVNANYPLCKAVHFLIKT
jgi:hypothetical protein